MINRRDFIRLTGAVAMGTLAGGARVFTKTAWSAESRIFQPDVELALRAVPAETAILPGNPTQVWSFQGNLMQGPLDGLSDTRKGMGRKIDIDNYSGFRYLFEQGAERL